MLTKISKKTTLEPMPGKVSKKTPHPTPLRPQKRWFRARGATPGALIKKTLVKKISPLRAEKECFARVL